MLVKWFLGLGSAQQAVASITVLAVAAGAGAFVVARNAPEGQLATVERVVDGDTVDVRFHGDTHRVRLLNVDSPETVDPNATVQCLGPEASQFLDSRLPAGTEVRLLFDTDRFDRYGRLLAGVVRDGDLINAAIAREGLGVAVLFEPNDRFYSEVLAAQHAATAAGVGLYDETVECTLPATIQAFTEAGETAEQAAMAVGAGAGLDEYDRHITDVAAAAAAAATLTTLVDRATSLPAAAYTDRERAGWRAGVSDTVARLTTAMHTLDADRAVEVERIKAEQRAAAEAARVAAEEAARLAAEEAARQAAAEEAARQAAADQAARDAAARRSSSSSGSSSGSGSSGGSGYTGCRAYAPGGKTWTPIACP